MDKPYVIAAEALTEELIVNKSRFICYLSPCNSIENAKAFIKEVQALHPQASHHCYAFIAGDPNDGQKYGFSDDGEPSGTAGKPMLNVLLGSSIAEVCAVVVRYFGGTKLGTGGLQRAYGGSVRQAIELLPTKIKIPMVHKTLACQYTQVDDVFHILNQSGVEVVDKDYAENITLTLALPMEEEQNIIKKLETMSSGQLKLATLTK